MQMGLSVMRLKGLLLVGESQQFPDPGKESSAGSVMKKGSTLDRREAVSVGWFAGQFRFQFQGFSLSG